MLRGCEREDHSEWKEHSESTEHGADGATAKRSGSRWEAMGAKHLNPTWSVSVLQQQKAAGSRGSAELRWWQVDALSLARRLPLPTHCCYFEEILCHSINRLNYFPYCASDIKIGSGLQKFCWAPCYGEILKQNLPGTSFSANLPELLSKFVLSHLREECWFFFFFFICASFFS